MAPFIFDLEARINQAIEKLGPIDYDNPVYTIAFGGWVLNPYYSSKMVSYRATQWKGITREYPELYKGMPRPYHITPFTEQYADILDQYITEMTSADSDHLHVQIKYAGQVLGRHLQLHREAKLKLLVD